MMKHRPPLCAIALALAATLAFAGSASAECYADYKAKKDSPLRLHYGVILLDDADCDRPRAADRAISERIAVDGWTLLNVLSIFGPKGLAERTESAGKFYLRY